MLSLELVETWFTYLHMYPISLPISPNSLPMIQNMLDITHAPTYLTHVPKYLTNVPKYFTHVTHSYAACLNKWLHMYHISFCWEDRDYFIPGLQFFLFS